MNGSISIKNLCGGYKDKYVLHKVNLDFVPGTFTAIAGPNGCGKTTLLKYLIKELKTTDETIFVLDNDINSLSQKELAKKLSFVSQSSKCSSSFTVYELVEFGCFCHDRQEIRQQVEKAIESVGISGIKNADVTKISGGEFQLAMLARAICQDTPVMVLDEPANNLDPVHQMHMMSILKNLSENGKTVICVLHDLNSVFRYCTDCILMKDGIILSSGKTNEVLTQENIKNAYGCDCSIISQADGQELVTFYYSPSPLLHHD